MNDTKTMLEGCGDPYHIRDLFETHYEESQGMAIEGKFRTSTGRSSLGRLILVYTQLCDGLLYHKAQGALCCVPLD